jgi:hypothetical protein
MPTASFVPVGCTGRGLITGRRPDNGLRYDVIHAWNGIKGRSQAGSQKGGIFDLYARLEDSGMPGLVVEVIRTPLPVVTTRSVGSRT